MLRCGLAGPYSYLRTIGLGRGGVDTLSIRHARVRALPSWNSKGQLGEPTSSTHPCVRRYRRAIPSRKFAAAQGRGRYRAIELLLKFVDADAYFVHAPQQLGTDDLIPNTALNPALCIFASRDTISPAPVPDALRHFRCATHRASRSRIVQPEWRYFILRAHTTRFAPRNKSSTRLFSPARRFSA